VLLEMLGVLTPLEDRSLGSGEVIRFPYFPLPLEGERERVRGSGEGEGEGTVSSR
jgi:hypothetical protein